MKKTYLQKHIDREFPILWEGNSKTEQTGPTRYFGYTPNFIRTQIDVTSDEIITNKIQLVKLSSMNPNGQNVISVQI